MHLDFDESAAFAIFAAPAFHIETEAPRIVSAHAGRGKLTEELADRRERAGVRDRVRARRAADRALVDHDRFIQLIEPAERAMRPWFVLRIVEMPEERAAQNVIDQS